VTARGDSTTTQEAISPNSAVPLAVHGGHWARGFKARVGVGMDSNQRVARGVVAIPWHWGDKGLATGSRANDLCIDAWDANTWIPEYKACLCRIVRL
jgi:anaerobic selenocysteine-containing dehydrogenase